MDYKGLDNQSQGRFVIRDRGGKVYFKNPSYQRWDLVKNKSEATVFDTLEEANDMVDILNRAIGATYWDWVDIVPEPVVETYQ